jgi:hypothetical protein
MLDKSAPAEKALPEPVIRNTRIDLFLRNCSVIDMKLSIKGIDKAFSLVGSFKVIVAMPSLISN